MHETKSMHDDLYANRARYRCLERQHSLLRHVLGRYPPVLSQVLAADTSGLQKACLDLGCGSGGWIMEVARDFPKCNAVAVDILPVQPQSIPPNCLFEVDDVNLGLEHWYGNFDVVHARLIAVEVKDFRRLIDQISFVLRPGGLVFLAEFDFRVYDGSKRPVNTGTDTTGSSLARWMAHWKSAISLSGGSAEVSTSMVQWITQHKSFEDVVQEEYWVPTSPWGQGTDRESAKYRNVAELVRNGVTAFVTWGRSTLLSSGLPEALVNKLEDNITRDFAEAKSPQYLRMQVVHARRNFQKSSR